MLLRDRQKLDLYRCELRTRWGKRGFRHHHRLGLRQMDVNLRALGGLSMYCDVACSRLGARLAPCAANTFSQSALILPQINSRDPDIAIRRLASVRGW